jgi:hypothetical protein
MAVYSWFTYSICSIFHSYVGLREGNYWISTEHAWSFLQFFLSGTHHSSAINDGSPTPRCCCWLIRVVRTLEVAAGARLPMVTDLDIVCDKWIGHQQFMEVSWDIPWMRMLIYDGVPLVITTNYWILIYWYHNSWNLWFIYIYDYDDDDDVPLVI